MALVRNVLQVRSRPLLAQHCVTPVHLESSLQMLRLRRAQIVLRLLNPFLVLRRASAARDPQAQMVAIARAVLLGNLRVLWVVQDAATAGKEHFPGPSALRPVLRAQSALQIQTRPQQALL